MNMSESVHNGIYDACGSEHECLSPAAQLFAGLSAKCAYCPASATVMPSEFFATRPVDTLYGAWRAFWPIAGLLVGFANARIAVQLLPFLAGAENSIRRLLLEFIVSTVPTVLCLTVFNAIQLHYVLGMAVVFLLMLWYKRCWQKAHERTFHIGRRPGMLTLSRTAINYCTVLCILAIDFCSFPKDYRKSRRYGIGLMDVGIGLFVMAMGSVSRRPRRFADLVHLLRTVLPLLMLGLARTVVIMFIGYPQDVHEYGAHLNAFFTLGLTKLFGTLLAAVTKRDFHLLLLGLVTLIMHEIVLQIGMADFVMAKDGPRESFWTANREGLCSLPGFVALFILSMYFGQWLVEREPLTYRALMRKYRVLNGIGLILWLLVPACAYTVGIARVTCSFGYVAWVLAITLFMTAHFMFIFDFALDTLWPPTLMEESCTPQLSTLGTKSSGDGNSVGSLSAAEAALLSPARAGRQHLLFAESINQNGLIYFLLANVLTGGVNIFLKPEDRTAVESVLILFVYMLLATGFVYMLRRFNIRIA